MNETKIPRAAAARCAEASVLLMVTEDVFKAFINIVPDMRATFAVSTALFAHVNNLMSRDDVANIRGNADAVSNILAEPDKKMLKMVGALSKSFANNAP